VDILWICVMAGPRKTALERASSLLDHWERRLEFYQLHVALRDQADARIALRWQVFLLRLDEKLKKLRVRHEILLGLEEAANSDTLSLDARQQMITVPGAAERFAAFVAESERRLMALQKTHANDLHS
jgi:hypothetical protein